MSGALRIRRCWQFESFEWSNTVRTCLSFHLYCILFHGPLSDPYLRNMVNVKTAEKSVLICVVQCFSLTYSLFSLFVYFVVTYETPSVVSSSALALRLLLPAGE